MKEFTTKKYWEDLKREVPSKGKRTADYWFREILDENLSKTKGVALEIGCVPGNFLVYLCKTFGYSPEGIDFDQRTFEITSQTLKDNGLNNYKIYQEDFNKWKPKKKYDLVCSFGFIEHFDNAKEIVQRHIDLTKKGGKIVITIPNFGGFNGFLRRLVDKPNLEKHNTKIMNLNFFQEIAIENKNNLKIKYLGYYGDCNFQWGYGRRETANLCQMVIYANLKLISKLTRHIKMRNKLSSYIVFIAEKK